ncbi:MAG: hypothetical protein ACP5D7_22175, partial [Limnospira sp.]
MSLTFTGLIDSIFFMLLPRLEKLKSICDNNSSGYPKTGILPVKFPLGNQFPTSSPAWESIPHLITRLGINS